MIKKLRRRIFWITELLPLSVLFLVLVSYNYSYISYTLSDEIDTLDYCTESVSKYPETMDKYIKMPINDLVEISESNEISNNRVRNVLYTIIADEVNIIKIDENNNLVESARDLGDIDISLYTKDKGKVDQNLYKYAEENGYRYLVILDTSNWLTSITVSVGLSFIALLFAALLFFVVAWYLSKKVTAPVEEAITKQNRFVADASHELKTPVAVINANIAVLEHEFGENKWMNYIKEEGHSMNMLVNQLLSLSRLDHEKEKSGRKKGKIEASFNVYDSIMEAALPFDSIAFEKEAIITTYCDREFTGRGYLSDFKQMIAILVDNAIDHVNRGGEITIKARTFSTDSIKSKGMNLIMTAARRAISVLDCQLPKPSQRKTVSTCVLNQRLTLLPLSSAFPSLNRDVRARRYRNPIRDVSTMTSEHMAPMPMNMPS